MNNLQEPKQIKASTAHWCRHLHERHALTISSSCLTYRAPSDVEILYIKIPVRREQPAVCYNDLKDVYNHFPLYVGPRTLNVRQDSGEAPPYKANRHELIVLQQNCSPTSLAVFPSSIRVTVS